MDNQQLWKEFTLKCGTVIEVSNFGEINGALIVKNGNEKYLSLLD